MGHNENGVYRVMGSKLFVGGLAWATSDVSLRKAFETFGVVRDAKVITDRESGQSRGFGFVTFEQEDDARTAMDQMNGAVLDGRTVRVNEAEEKQRTGGGGGGGYRQNGGGGGGSREWGNSPAPQVETRGGYGDRNGGRGGRGGGGDRGGRGGDRW